MFSRITAAAAIVGAMAGGLVCAEDMIVPSARAEASRTVTVDGTDYPVCSEEDCSDQPGQVGVWFSPNDGKAWLSQGEASILVRCSDICLGA